MIRNSSKILHRLEKAKSGNGKFPGGDDQDEDGDEELKSMGGSNRVPSISGTSFKSAGSTFSLSKRIHLPK